MEHPQLKNAPIVETVCEFRFAPNSPWDWTVPGQLYDLVKASYPDRQEVVPHMFTIGPNASEAPAIMPERIRLTASDGLAMIQTGPRLLTVNLIAPYPGWPAFLERIRDALAKHVQVCGWQPLSRIGLLCINRIDTDEEAGAVLTIQPRIDSLPNSVTLSGFLQQWEFTFDSSNLVLASTRATDPKPGYVIQLDASTTSPTWMQDASNIEAWLDLAHETVYQVFRSSLTSETFERLKA